MAGEDRVAELEAQNEALRAQVAELVVAVAALKSRVADLEAQLKRTSKNSSVPPSTDPNETREQAKLNRAQRRQAQRRQGKQPGAEGRHLSQVEHPDRRVIHRPARCTSCGGGLADARLVGSEKRQVFDLPPIAVEVTEHLSQRLKCSCGCVTAGAFPADATAPACWGPGVRALGIYLTQRQHIPVARAAEMLSDVLGAPVSTGFLAGLVPEAAGALVPFVARVRDLLGISPVLHADETSIRVSAQSWWLHVMSTTKLTLLVCHRKRGREAIEAIDVLPGYTGTIVRDGLAAYDYLDTATHAQCGAHLIRHLGKAMEYDDTTGWAQLMTATLLDAAAAARAAGGQGWDHVPANHAARLKRRYRYALDVAFNTLPPGPPPRRRNTGGWEGHQRDAWNLAVRLRDDQADVLRFLTDTRIPFSNNNAERPLRPAKLHDKISGTFRSPEHARGFATIRSYLSTAAKQEKNLFAALTELFTTGPWLPPDAQPG